MVAATMVAINTDRFNQTFLVSENKTKRCSSPSWLIHHLHEKGIISAQEEHPGLWLAG